MRETAQNEWATAQTRPAPHSHLSWVDRGGMIISSLCLVHCLALPLLIAALPAFGNALPGDFAVHLILILVALPVTGFALWRGARAHGRRRPLMLGLTGLLLVATALPLTGFALVEAALTVGGGLLVVAAHVLNWRGHAESCRDIAHGH